MEINLELSELSDKQIERIDEVENAVYDLCKLLTQNDNIEWDMSYIGLIADTISDILVNKGFSINYPYISTEENGDIVRDWLKPCPIYFLVQHF